MSEENKGLTVAPTKEVTIQDLYKDQNLQLAQDQLTTFLNQAPPQEWVKLHPFIKGYYYLPIDKVEFLLKRFFKRYKIEIMEYKQILNSITCHVRVWYQDPITGEMIYHDGVGAEELQTVKDSGPLKLDASNINKGAVKMALPIAKTVAIKDATDHIGDIFGANLNRKDIMQWTPDATLEQKVNQKEHNRMMALINKSKTRAELDELRSHLTDLLTPIFEEKWMSIK